MKFFILFCCILAGCVVNIVSASMVYEQIAAGESSVKFQTKTLYTFIQDKDLLATAERVCTSESRQK